MKISFNKGKCGLFAAGVLFGTAGLKILGSRDAKNVYANATAAVLRAKDYVMDTATNLQENAEDILAEAIIINEEREAEEAWMDEFMAEEEEAAEEDEAEENGAE